MARPIVMTYAPTALDRDGISVAQTTAGAADLTITGALASGGAVTLGSQQFVTAYSGGNISTVIFTIYGTDRNGVTLTDTITGVNNSTVVSAKSFYTVTRVAASAVVGTNVEIGVNGLGDSRSIPVDYRINPANIAVACAITGSPTYTVQYTYDDPFATTFSSYGATWFTHPTLSGQTASADSLLTAPVRALRVRQTAGSGATVAMTIIQSGP